MFELAPARSGGPTASINGTLLHSAYNPEREAIRFVQNNAREVSKATIVLLGAGLGYLIQAVRRQSPHSRIIALFYSAEIADNCFSRNELAACWQPEQSPLLSFLRHEIHELESEGLTILEWHASAQIFPGISMKANLAIRQLLQEHRGNLVTTQSMGRMWVRNSFYNFVHLAPQLCLSPETTPASILIAASGPSLRRSVDLIRKHRDRLWIWALPSAGLFLTENGLAPDLVIMTDPGFHATQHLHLAVPQHTALAMPLSAAPGAWRVNAKVFFFSQKFFYEQTLYAQTGLAPPTILPHGTVAASALDLALQIGRGDIFLAGLDLFYEDIHAHIRPNAFERSFLTQCNRLQPLLHTLSSRACSFAPVREYLDGEVVRSNLALETYAGWFAAAARGSRVRRLFPRRPIAGLATIEPDQFEKRVSASVKVSGQLFVDCKDYPDKRRRQDMAVSVLESWVEGIKNTLVALNRCKSVQPFLRDALQISLAYTLTTGHLLEVKRFLRTGKESQALPKVKNLLNSELSFFSTLSRKIG